MSFHSKSVPVILLFSLASVMSLSVDADDSPEAESRAAERAATEAVSTVDHAISVVQQVPNVGKENCPQNEIKYCEFGDVCRSIAPNRNAKNLYENAEGQVIPNFKMQEELRVLSSCREELTAPTAPYGELMAKEKELKKKKKSDEIHAEFEAKHKIFTDSIIAHPGEADALEKLQSEALAHAAMQTGGMGMSTAPQPSGSPREILKKQIIEALLHAHVHWSDETLNAYLDWMTPLEYGKMNGGDQPPDIDQDPFSNTKILYDVAAAGGREKVMANQKTYQTQLDRAQGVFKDTKKRIIDYLISRRSPGNAAQIDNMIQRISLIEMGSLETFNPAQQSTCKTPNAYYWSNTHKFILCPQMLPLPDAALAQTIAHELGHAIDPCDVARPLIIVTNETAKPKLLGSNDKSGKATDGIIPFHPHISSTGKVYIELNPNDADASLHAKYSSFESKVILPSISAMDNPFASTIACLQTPASVSARVGDMDLAARRVDAKIQVALESGATDGDLKIKGLRHSKRLLRDGSIDLRSCSEMESLNGRSQMQEAFADFISERVLDEKVSEIARHSKEAAQQYAFESVGFYAAMGCETITPDSKQLVQDATDDATCSQDWGDYVSAVLASTNAGDSHPFVSTRVSRAYLALPAVEKALQCKPDPSVSTCE